MPKLPMYHTPTDPDAWHRVTAPGGYEWWHFDAEDEAGEVRVVARLYDGHPFDAEYVRAYRRFLRNPTLRTPPMPVDFPYAELAVYRGETIWGQFGVRFPRGAFIGSVDRLEVALGPNRLTKADRVFRLLMSDAAAGMRAELRFSPSSATTPLVKTPPAPRQLTSEQAWIAAECACDVEGSVTVAGERREFRGRGHHDHRYGTAPIA
jgi:hypothetical protein